MPTRGIDLANIAQIFRDKNSKEATLNLVEKADWSVYVGNDIQGIDTQSPILKTDDSGLFDLKLNKNKRYYFKLKNPFKEFYLAEKSLPLQGAYNFRDLGGIFLKGNRRVKWGKLFRSDELSCLTNSDMEYLSSIGIRSVIDFRTENEIKKAPDRVLESVKFNYPIAITPGAVRTSNYDQTTQTRTLQHQMEEMYEKYVTDPNCIRAFRIMFLILQNNLSAPLIFHCSAGKDRTGIASALVLLALGATEDEVTKDYLMSKHFIPLKYRNIVDKYPRMAPVFTVKRAYLMKSLQQIKKDYGSIDYFLKNVLGADMPKLRRVYTETINVFQTIPNI